MRPKVSDFGKFAKINLFFGSFFGADFQKHFQDFGHKPRKHCKQGVFFGGILNLSVQDFGDKGARTQKNRERARNPKILGASRLRAAWTPNSGRVLEFCSALSVNSGARPYPEATRCYPWPSFCVKHAGPANTPL